MSYGESFVSCGEKNVNFLKKPKINCITLPIAYVNRRENTIPSRILTRIFQKCTEDLIIQFHKLAPIVYVKHRENHNSNDDKNISKCNENLTFIKKLESDLILQI